MKKQKPYHSFRCICGNEELIVPRGVEIRFIGEVGKTRGVEFKDPDNEYLDCRCQCGATVKAPLAFLEQGIIKACSRCEDHGPGTVINNHGSN